MSNKAMPCDDALWGPWVMGHDFSIVGLALHDRSRPHITHTHGVIVDMEVRNFGENKPASFLMVSAGKLPDIARECAHDESGNAFKWACEEEGVRFFRRYSVNSCYRDENETIAVFANGAGTMAYDAGPVVAFAQHEYAWLAGRMRPGARAWFHDGARLSSAYVKRASLYPVIKGGKVRFKVRLELNGKGPRVARDEMPPFEDLVYS